MPFDINDHGYSAPQDLLDLASKNDVIWRSTGMVMLSISISGRHISVIDSFSKGNLQ